MPLLACHTAFVFSIPTTEINNVLVLGEIYH